MNISLLLSKHAILFFAAIVWSQNVQAQVSKAIEIDTLTGGSKETVTADRENLFIVPISAKTEIQNVNYYRVNKNGCKARTTRREYRNYIIKPLYLKDNARCELSFKEKIQLHLPKGNGNAMAKLKSKRQYNPRENVLPVISKTVVRTDKSSNLYIKTQPFDPSTNYQFEIYKDATDQETATAIRILYLIRNNRANEAEALFIKTYPKNPKFYYNASYPGLYNSFSTSASSPDTSLIKAYDRFYQKSDFLTAFTTNYPKCSLSDAFDKLLASAFACNNCKEQESFQDIYASRDLLLADYYSAVIHINDSLSREKTADITAMKKLYKALGTPLDIDLFSNQLAINKIITWRLGGLKRLQAASSKVVDQQLSNELFTSIQSEINCLEALSKHLAPLFKSAIELRKALNQNAQIKHTQKLGNNGEVLALNTNIINFKTRGENLINPCFGFVALGTLQSSKSTFWDVPGYIGFHINLRPIDKNIPFRLLPNRGIQHYLSFFAALTLTSLGEEGKREDLFGKKSLLTGVGFRVNNAIRLTAGTAWVKKIDPDPITTKKSAAVLPYIGVSVDLDLKGLFGGLSSLF
jgi:hypothetical protein